MSWRNRLGASDRLVIGLVLIQIALAGYVLYDVIVSLTGLRSEPLAWTQREAIEISAVLALILGMVAGAILVWRVRIQIAAVNDRLRVASQAFTELVDEEFNTWNLTPAEREVALLLLKGFSNAEIARIAGKAEGTVKAQCNAIFRKAEVSNRGQLASSFFEVLMQDPLETQTAARRGDGPTP